MKIKNIRSKGTFSSEDFKIYGNISGKKIEAEDEQGKKFEILVGRANNDYYCIFVIDGVKGKIFGVTPKFYNTIDHDKITERVVSQFNSLEDTKLIDFADI